MNNRLENAIKLFPRQRRLASAQRAFNRLSREHPKADLASFYYQDPDKGPVGELSIVAVDRFGNENAVISVPLTYSEFAQLTEKQKTR